MRFKGSEEQVLNFFNAVDMLVQACQELLDNDELDYENGKAIEEGLCELQRTSYAALHGGV